MSDILVPNCPFCSASNLPDQHVLFENTHCRYLRKAQSKLTGAGLIVPRNHRQTVFDLSDIEWEHTFNLLKRVKRYLEVQFSPDGYTVGWNCGEAGGQDIPHAHLHVIPRFVGRPDAAISIRKSLEDALL